jgi:hypothetical protein
MLAQSRERQTGDEFIGELIFDPIIGQWSFVFRIDYINKFSTPDKSVNNTVAIVLESPHIHEFSDVDLDTNDERRVNSRPLNNPNSRNGLKRMLNSTSFANQFSSRLNKNRKYDVVLVNAIQYQCSLGEDTSKYRDDVFILNWIDLQNDFVERIKRINPALIINCCTKGSWKEDKYIDETRLLELGLERKNDSPLFYTSFSKNRNDFTLKSLVECKLKFENIINPTNYFKFDHPSAIRSNEVREIRNSDIAIVADEEFHGVGKVVKKTKRTVKVQDRFVEVILKDITLKGTDWFFIRKPGSSRALTSAIWADHALETESTYFEEPSLEVLNEYFDLDFRIIRLLQKSINRHNIRLKYSFFESNCVEDEYVSFEYPPAEFSPYGFDPELDSDEFENYRVHPLIDATRYLLKEFDNVLEDRMGQLSVHDLTQCGILTHYNGMNGNNAFAISLEDEEEMNSYVSYDIKKRQLDLIIDTSFIDKVVKRILVPENIAVSNSFGEYLQKTIREFVEESTEFEF